VLLIRLATGGVCVLVRAEREYAESVGRPASDELARACFSDYGYPKVTLM
jgi:hypothetical protein